MIAVLVFASIYGILVLLVYLAQDSVLYIPGTQGPEEAIRVGLVPWPDQQSYHGLVSRDEPRDQKGTFLIWHGNAGAAMDRIYYISALERRGYRAVLMEYPGYGARDGKLGEDVFVKDAIVATTKARRDFEGPLFVLGESLGCGVATAVAKRFRGAIKGVILITPWADLPSLAQSKFWYLPAKWLTRDKYDNIVNLSQFRGPVAIGMAGHDEIIPTRHTRRLFDAVKSPKRLWEFQNSGHNSWPVAPEEPWWGEVLEFVNGK